jgi:enoyl-CoA hydratase/carnithine racemase
MHAETMAVELTLRSNDFKEGMRAFAEKRPPEFTGT